MNLTETKKKNEPIATGFKGTFHTIFCTTKAKRSHNFDYLSVIFISFIFSVGSGSPTLQKVVKDSLWPGCCCGGGEGGSIGSGQDVNLGLAVQPGRVGQGRPGQVHDVHRDEGGLEQPRVRHMLLNLGHIKHPFKGQLNKTVFRIRIYYYMDPDPGPHFSPFGFGSWREPNKHK